VVGSGPHGRNLTNQILRKEKNYAKLSQTLHTARLGRRIH
jgi:hypothetical protein